MRLKEREGEEGREGGAHVLQKWRIVHVEHVIIDGVYSASVGEGACWADGHALPDRHLGSLDALHSERCPFLYPTDATSSLMYH